MKKQLVHVSSLQTAKVAAALYLLISVPLVALMALPLLFGSDVGMPWFFLLAMPILYAVFGYIFSLLGSWIYNLVAAQIGGIEFTTREVDQS